MIYSKNYIPSRRKIISERHAKKWILNSKFNTEENCRQENVCNWLSRKVVDLGVVDW